MTSTQEKYLMVAGGIGITPIRALIESLANAHRDIVLLYAVKTARDLVFGSELRALTGRCHFVLSRSVSSDGYEQGRVDRVMLERLVPDLRDREVFVCGPLAMMKAVIGALHALEVRGSRIHYERFAKLMLTLTHFMLPGVAQRHARAVSAKVPRRPIRRANRIESPLLLTLVD